MEKNFTKLSHEVIGSAIEVHKIPGPGLFESAYQQCLAHELKLTGVRQGFLINFNVKLLRQGLKSFVL